MNLTKRKWPLIVIAAVVLLVTVSAAFFWLAPSGSTPLPSANADSLKGDVKGDGGRPVSGTPYVPPGSQFFCRAPKLENIGTRAITLRSIQPLEMSPGVEFDGSLLYKSDEHHPHNLMSWAPTGADPLGDPRTAKNKLQLDGLVLEPGRIQADELMAQFTIEPGATYPIKVREMIVTYERDGITLKQTLLFGCGIMAKK